MLRLWPTDEQILQTVHHSHNLARELAEFLQMLQPAELSIEINEPRIVISAHDNEVSTTIITEDETDENNESDISPALNKASAIMRNITTEIYEKEDYQTLFNEGRYQLKIIGERMINLSTINNGGDSGKFFLTFYYMIIMININYIGLIYLQLILIINTRWVIV